MGFALALPVSSRDLEILTEALGTLYAEYGLDEDGRALLARVREARDTMRKTE